MNDVPTAPILLLEDERATAALISQLLAAERITNPVDVVDTAAGALDYLGRVVSGEARIPVVCVLDLSLPDMSGLEVLRHIRSTPALSRLTVIMLTGSGNDADIDTAYDLGIDAYLIKPAGVHGLPDVLRELHLPYELILERERPGE
ncbi:MAG TPA: response regulator [Solirubrobacteraceae bacterium]|nr:response regulator [Solirubrobacteraceae bacterium]